MYQCISGLDRCPSQDQGPKGCAYENNVYVSVPQGAHAGFVPKLSWLCVQPVAASIPAAPNLLKGYLQKQSQNISKT